VTVYATSAELTSITRLVIDTAVKALKAWADFPNKVPFQAADGEMMPLCEFLQPPEFKGGN
jgi:hypothetical protein